MAAAQQDLLHVLAREHRDQSVSFHELIGRDRGAAPRQDRRQFGSLVLRLGVHFTAERLLVHPLVDRAVERGEDTRQEREREITVVCGLLAGAGAALHDPDRFREDLRSASREVASHADREELEVFVYVRHVAAPKQLRRLGNLHTALRQRLPARYLRDGDAPAEPWSDPHLLELLRMWYADALPDDAPDTHDVTHDADGDGGRNRTR